MIKERDLPLPKFLYGCEFPWLNQLRSLLNSTEPIYVNLSQISTIEKDSRRNGLPSDEED